MGSLNWPLTPHGDDHAHRAHDVVGAEPRKLPGPVRRETWLMTVT